MKLTVYKASDRGSADYGWLKPNYYFSFSDYHDPEKVHFGLLRVLTMILLPVEVHSPHIPMTIWR